MTDNLKKAQDLFLDRINHLCEKLGLNNIMAQLYAILYLSDRALSLDDMVERLKISKGSASVNIRALESYGAVRRVWVRGSRKDFYEADTDIARVIMDRVKLIAMLRFSEIDELIKVTLRTLESVNYFDKEGEEGVKLFKLRLEKLEALRFQAKSFFDIVNSGFLSEIFNPKAVGSVNEVSLTVYNEQEAD